MTDVLRKKLCDACLEKHGYEDLKFHVPATFMTCEECEQEGFCIAVTIVKVHKKSDKDTA